MCFIILNILLFSFILFYFFSLNSSLTAFLALSPSSRIRSIDNSPDGHLVITASASPTICIWNVFTLNLVSSLEYVFFFGGREEKEEREKEKNQTPKHSKNKNSVHKNSVTSVHFQNKHTLYTVGLFFFSFFFEKKNY